MTVGRPSVTVDAFHRGAFDLVQPAAGGHRAGMDAMVLAAAVPDAFSGRVADLGSGAGAAGLAVLSRCQNAKVTLIERSREMLDYANASLALESNRSFSGRAVVIQADIEARGKDRHAAGLDDNSFDFAIMNPPFNSANDRRTPDPLKADAHVMNNQLIENWVKTAAALVKARGGFAVIIRPGSLRELLDAMKGRFGGIQIKPLLPHAGKVAIRVVARGIKGSRAELTIEPPLVLHPARGSGFTVEAEAVINGQTCLY